MTVEPNKRFLLHKFIQFNPVLTDEETVNMITEKYAKKNQSVNEYQKNHSSTALQQHLKVKYKIQDIISRNNTSQIYRLFVALSVAQQSKTRNVGQCPTWSPCRI